MDRKPNGAGASQGGAEAASGASRGVDAPPPEPVADLAGACVRFVEKALGVKLDYTPDTLPLLDHYLEQARGAVAERSEALPLLAQAAGAYFGEVIRRKHPSWWRTEEDDPARWRIELEAVHLAFYPVRFIQDALLRAPEAEDEGERQAAEGSRDASGHGSGDGEEATLILDEEDQRAVSARLADLPPVSEREYFATSTRLEVIDIAVDVIRARRLASGEEEDAALEPADYELED
jgi:hypothetical protein